MKKEDKNMFILVIILVVILSLYITYQTNLKDFIEFLAKIAPLLILGTLFIGINQLKLSRKQQLDTKQWNKNQLTLRQLHKTREKIKSILNDLEQKAFTKKEVKEVNIKPISEREIGESLTLKEIHILFGNGIYEPNNGFKYYIKDIKEENLNRDIRSIISNYLGEFEYIAAGANQDIFDKEIINNVIGYSFMRAFTTFHTYIYHLREVHFKDDSIYLEIEKLAKNFIENYEEYKKYKKFLK